MPKCPRKSLVLSIALLLLAACSPRDFLTRRLAGDLIAGSDTFKVTQQFWLRTGVISNKDFLSPEYLVLQRHGWITGATVKCPADLAPAPCWEVRLSPLGVDTLHNLLPASDAAKEYFSIPAARRELVSIDGLVKSGNVADVDFTWRWVPLNEVGAALYAGDVHYKSTVAFRHFDDGWRPVDEGFRSGQSLDDALKNGQPQP